MGKMIAHTDVPLQREANCTTRSIREYLRDTLPAPLFDDIYELASTKTASEHKEELLAHQQKQE